MKKTLLFIIFFSVVFIAEAQNVWIDNGAKWYYTYNVPAEQGYVEWNYTRDQNIGGNLCQVIEGKRHVYRATSPTSGWVYMYTTTFPTPFYTYASGDTVFHHTNGRFQVLYNFGASPGDSWVIDISYDSSSCTNDTSRVVVDSIGTVTLNGQSLRWISISPKEGWFALDSSSYFLYGKFVERFGLYERTNQYFRYTYYGTINSLFPVESIRRTLSMPSLCDTNLIAEYYAHHFYCFSDTSFSFSTDISDAQCLAPSIGMNEINLNQLVKVYPNPSNNFEFINIGLESLKINRIEVVNIDGKIIPVKYNKGRIKFEGRGLFILKVYTEKGIVNKKLIRE